MFPFLYFVFNKINFFCIAVIENIFKVYQKVPGKPELDDEINFLLFVNQWNWNGVTM